MAEKAAIKLKDGERSLKAKGPAPFVRSVFQQLKDSGMKLNQFRYKAAGEQK